MRVFSRLQRKAVCMGLLWGILSATGTTGTGIGFLRIPLQTATAACRFSGATSHPMLIYLLAILLAAATMLTLVTALESFSSRLLYWHISTRKPARSHNQQGRNK